LGTQVYGY